MGRLPPAQAWARSSVVEHRVHTAGVASSILAAPTTPSPMTALRIDGLTKRHGGRAALDDVSLAVEAGAVRRPGRPVGIGQDHPAQVDQPPRRARRGHDRARRPRRARRCRSPALRHGIGYVIQSIGLFPHMNVAENIAIVPRLIGARARTASAELLELVALPAEIAGALSARAFRRPGSSGSASPGRWRRGRS